MITLKYSKKYLLLISFTVLFLSFVFYMAATQSDPELEPNYTLTYIFGSIGIILIFFFIDSILLEVKVDDEQILKKTFFRNLTLKKDEIEGYRHQESYIVIYPKNKKKSKIYLSTYLDIENLPKWFWNKTLDLDEIDNKDEENREKRDFDKLDVNDLIYQKLKKFLKYYNNIGLILGILALVYPYPYKLIILLIIIMPLIGIYLLNRYNEIIHIDKKDDSIFLNANNGISMPIFGLLIRSIFDLNVELNTEFWFITFILSTSLSYLFYKKNYEILKDKSIIIIFFTFTFIYICCFTVMANRHFDTSTPQEIRTIITAKRDSGGDSKRYYLNFEPLINYNDISEVSITKSQFNRLDTGDEIVIVTKKGVFNLYSYGIKTE